MKNKITEAQKRILDILSDGTPHTLLVELEGKGHWNQYPAIKALVVRNRIRVVDELGFYSRWELT